MVPGLSDLIDCMKEEERIVDLQTLTNKSSGIWNAFYSLGAITAPIFGGLAT